MAETTYTDVTWTAGDIITEAKLDNMVANDRAVDAMAQGVEFTERSAPSSPASNKIHLYAKDDGGLTKLFTKDSAGTEESIGISATKAKFKATRSTGQTIPTDTPTKIQYNNEIYDPGSNYDNATNYRFTVPQDGFYLITASMSLDTMSDGDRMQIQIYVNSGIRSISVTHHAFTGTRSVNITDILSLSSGDFIEIYGRHTHGSNRQTGASDDNNYFAMHLLSV